MLPESVLALAWRLFEKEEVIVDIVESSVLVNVTYAGVEIPMHVNADADMIQSLGEESTWFTYDLDTLGDESENSEDMLNILDVGGSFGIVTIAAMKKYPERLRAITVEASPTMFFYLKWNLAINGIPEIDETAGLPCSDEKGNDPAGPGVLALNRAPTENDGDELHYCIDPDDSTKSRICDCDKGVHPCVIVPGIAMESLTSGMFSSEPIAMVKIDCQYCESQSLSALAANTKMSERVRRLVGQLHAPDQRLEEIACRWDHGRLMSKCGDGECGLELSCDSAAASGAGDEEPDKAGDEEASASDGDDDSDVARYASEANVADNSSSSDNDDDSDVDRYASEANVADN